jgi:hypothetical protein
MRRLKVTAKGVVTERLGDEEVNIECELEFVGLSSFKVLKGNTSEWFYDYKQVSNVRDLKWEQIKTTAAEQIVGSNSAENLCADNISHDDFLKEYAERLNVTESKLLNVLLSYCDRFYVRIFLEAYKFSSFLDAEYPNTVLASIKSKIYSKKVKNNLQN